MSALDVALLEAYYERRNTRPVVGFYVGEYFPLRQYRAATGLPQGAFGVDDVACLDWRPDYERLFALHDACPGDLLYTATAFVGVPWMEAALGCPVVVRSSSSSNS